MSENENAENAGTSEGTQSSESTTLSQVENTTTESTEESNADSTETDEETIEGEKPQKNRAQKRIDQLTREKYELRAKIDQLQNNSNQNNQNNGNSERDIYSIQKPKREGFDSDEEFVEALTDWKIEQKEYVNRDRQFKNELQQKALDFQKKEAVLSNEIPDYYEAIEESRDVRINQAAVNAMVESDIGPQLRYYFAKNPEEAEKTLSMKPTEAVKFIGRIEAKIEADIKNKKSVTAKNKTSNAPPPVKPVKTNSGGNTHVDLNDPNVPIDVWLKRRREQAKR
jgi:hypothetical protein